VTAQTYLGVDHVAIRVADVQPLFDILSGRLGLPVTWPLEYAAFATFGWIGVGNTNLEIWAAADNSDLPAGCPLPLVHQIALAPVELSESLARVDAMGLKCKTPRAFQSQDTYGHSRTNFTNSVVLDLSSDSLCVFFCEWRSDAPIVPWSKGLTTHERRRLQRDAVAGCGGGPVGMLGLRQIAISTRSPERTTENWARLTESGEASLMLTDDIELHVFLGDTDAIRSLTFGMRDLATARRFLHDQGLLEPQSSDVTLALAATGGVELRFVHWA
jgi:hypothetical protein